MAGPFFRPENGESGLRWLKKPARTCWTRQSHNARDTPDWLEGLERTAMYVLRRLPGALPRDQVPSEPFPVSIVVGLPAYASPPCCSQLSRKVLFVSVLLPLRQAEFSPVNFRIELFTGFAENIGHVCCFEGCRDSPAATTVIQTCTCCVN